MGAEEGPNDQVKSHDSKISGAGSPEVADKNKNRSHFLKSRKSATVVATVKKGQGVRQRRRLENTNFLLSLVENEEYSSHEETFSEFVSSASSSFETLFSNKKSMEIWNDFINQTGEEQEEFLNHLGEMGEVRGTLAKVEKEQKEKEVAMKDEDEEFTVLHHTDERQAHPANTPKECYARINSSLRAFLRRRHFPKGSLENHEEELVAWFTEDPHSVWVSHLPNSFERLLLHAVSQYLDLNSSSYDCQGIRQTKVENKNDHFHPPLMCLSKYLDSFR